MAVVDLKGSVGMATARRLILPGFFFETRGHTPFVNEEKRREPVDMHYGDRVTDQVTYHLPEESPWRACHRTQISPGRPMLYSS